MAYSQAQKKAHIQELQKYLNAISYYHPEIPCVLPTGIYDQKTNNRSDQANDGELARILRSRYNGNGPVAGRDTKCSEIKERCQVAPCLILYPRDSQPA